MSATYHSELRYELMRTLHTVLMQLREGAAIDTVVVTQRAASTLAPERCLLIVDDGMRCIEIGCEMGGLG